MQNQVADVVAGRVHSPQPPLYPERRIGHGPVVGRFGGAPKPIRAIRGLYEVIVCEKIIVIQDESAFYGRQISKEGDQDDYRYSCQHTEAEQRCDKGSRSGSASLFIIERFLSLGHMLEKLKS